jgi:exopolysaccharide biosynthesis polyprenyl glycosylphosphotransferase
MNVAPSATSKAITVGPITRRLRGSPQLLHRIHLAALILGDLIATNLAFFVAYGLRYVYEIGGDVPGESYVEYAAYLPVQILFVAFCLAGYQMRGTYRMSRASSPTAEAMSIVGSTMSTAFLVIAVATLVHYPALSRLTVIYACLFTVIFTIASRATLRSVRARLYQVGVGAQRAIVVGNNRLARMVMQMLAQEHHLGFQVVGFVDNSVRTNFGRFRALGPIEQLPNLVDELVATRVVVALPAAQHADAIWVLEHCRRDGLSVSMVPDLFDVQLSHVRLDSLGGIPLFGVKESSIAGWNLFVKRLIDISVSMTALLLLAPLFAIVALAIKLDSPGPVFFRQCRLGKGSVPFACYKFRSMYQDAEAQLEKLRELNEADGPIFKMRDDPRLTRIGRLLRRTSIDELPQLWNVLINDMSLVGPRPPLPVEVEQYEDWHRRRLEVVPGLTGLWQVSGRSSLSFEEMVMLDIYYIENWSLGLDLQIMLRTVPAVIATAGAY